MGEGRRRTGALFGLRWPAKQAQMWGMTDAPATGPAADSPRVSARLDDNDPPWPLRPWIMAAICAAAGLAFHALVDHHYEDALAQWRSALATAVAVAAVVFVLGRRAAPLALGAGLCAAVGRRAGADRVADGGV